MVTLYQLALTIGIVIAYFSNAYLANHASQTAESEILNSIFSAEVWRGMLGLGAIPAAVFLLCILLVPESPRWLLLKGKKQKATDILI